MIVISPSDVVRALERIGISIRFSADELEYYDTTPLVHDDGRVLGYPVPMMNSALNLRVLKQRMGETDTAGPLRIFDHPWYENEPFMKECCPPGWHFIQMDVSAESIGQPFDYHRSLEAGGYGLAAAVEVVVMLILHYSAAGEHLLQKKHTWTLNQANLGRAVTVGAFGRNGIFLSSHPPQYTSRGLGMCGTIRIQPSETFSR